MSKYLIIILLFSSCQSRTDLSQLVLNEDIDTLIKNRNDFYADDVDPATGLPIIYTYKVKDYCFDNYNLVDNSEKSIAAINSVGFYLQEPLKKNNIQIAGIVINVYDKVNALYNVAERLYGKPQVLAEKPSTEYDGILQGSEAWLWQKDQKTIVVARSYGSRNKTQAIDEILYILDNKISEPGNNNRTAAERLIQTFKE